MIDVIVCAHKNDQWEMHYEHIDTSIGCQYNYIRIDNSENKFGICAAYNKGVKNSSANILVFIHDDVYCITPNWGAFLETKFKADPSLGLIGVAGTEYLFHDNPSWVAAGQPFIHGKVVHESKSDRKIILSVYSNVNTDRNVIAVDGLFFAVPKSLFTSVQFDEVNFNSFHFYDLDICMQIRKSHKIIVTPDILVKHFSEGNFDDNWKYYGNIFLDKYSNELPVTCASEKPDIVKRVPFKSYDLKSMVNSQTFTYISNLGKRHKQKDDTNRNSENLAVVTGMHRSGTSCVAGLLDLCGYSLGSKLLLSGRNQPKFDNVKGLNEYGYINLINDKIINEAGGKWFHLPTQDAIDKKGDLFKHDIILFSKLFHGSLVKDPRFCLTIHIWKKYLSRIKNVIICLRHPIGVARSLFSRDSIAIETGVRLWYEYNKRLLENVKHVPFVIIDYDNFSTNLEDELFRVLQELKNPFPREKIKSAVQGYFESELNHNRSAIQDNEPLPEDVHKLYSYLKSINAT